MQVGGAQCKFVVHNVALYCLSGAQCSSQTQTDRQTESDAYELTMQSAHR